MDTTEEHKPKIIVDIERMKYPFTGLYFYCKDLALNLEKHHAKLFDFYFFSYPGVVLPSHLKLIIRRFIDKYYLLKPKKYVLWHSTWQDTKLVPRNNMKFVYTIHDLNFLYSDKSKYKKKELLQAVQEKIDRADAITVISNFVKSDILKHLDTRGKEIHVIHNGVELKKYPTFDAPTYKPAKKYLFTLGTVLYKKHFHVLPRILVGNNYELIIAGIHSNKNYITQIKEEADKYGVTDRVKLIGTISDKEKYWYLNNAEAFLFPSISEGFGLPPIEAMRLGKPTFLSTFTSLPEIGGKYAYYFNSFKPEAMRKVLEEGLDDYNTNNRKEEIIGWSKQFNWKKASTAYVAVYKKALGIEKSKEETIEYKKMPLTAIIPTLNESENIVAAIQSVYFADEIIVIDSYSTDDTVLLAKELGVRIIQRKFDDFSSQKNYAISKAKHDWVFILDADERLTTQLKNEIIATTYETNTKDAYWIFRQNFFAKKKIKYSGWQNDKVMRLFDRKLCKYEGLVHEEILNIGTTGYFTGKMLHYSCESKQEFKNKLEKYAILKSKELYSKRTKPNFFHFHIKPSYRFFYHYFIKFGFLDGKSGLAIAAINAYGMKMRYKELEKLYRDEKMPIKQEIQNAILTLQKGKTILYPTDTVWGIGCDATDEKAVLKVYAIKKRAESKSMIILVDSVKMLQSIISDIPKPIITLVKNTKTPTSYIFHNPKGLAKNVVAKDNTVAIRIAKDSFCRELIHKFGKPIVSTSANISTKSTPKKFSEIQAEILNTVDYIVDLHREKSPSKSSSIIKIHKDGKLEVLRK